MKVCPLASTVSVTGFRPIVFAFIISFILPLYAAAQSYSFSYTGPLTVPDNQCGDGYTGIGETAGTVVSGVGLLGTATARLDSIRVNVSLTWDSDLNMWLQSPTGQVLELTTGNGGSGDNYYNTIFTDNASLYITQGSAPFSGAFRPEGRNSVLQTAPSNTNALGQYSIAGTFNGYNANGTWSLVMCDAAGSDIPVLQNFTLYFTVLCSNTANDARSVNVLGPPQTTCPGTPAPFSAIITNPGNNDLNSLNVQWAVDGVFQGTIPYNELLTPCSTGQLDTVLLGNFTMVAGQNHLVRAWTSMPNGVVDGFMANDTSQAVFQSALSGTYTIGGANPSYPDIVSAVNALNSKGVCGPVVFNVRNGIYAGKVVISQIAGAGAVNTITFQSESGDSSLVQVTHNAYSTSTLTLDGTDYLIWRKMTVEATASYSQAVILNNTATHNVLENCVFRSAVSSGAAVVLFNATGQNEYNKVQNNRISQGYSGMELSGYYNNGNYVSGNEIVNNVFEGQSNRGLTVQLQHTPRVTGNVFYPSNATAFYEGIVADDCHFGGQITGNRCYAQERYGNAISMYGVYGTATDTMTVSNNYLAIGGSSSNASMGIYCYNNDYIAFLHNSIELSGPLGAGSTNFYRYGYGTGGTRFYNNILVNKGDRRCIEQYGSNWDSDYNDFYTTGAEMGLLNGYSVSDLAGWQASSGGKDIHSLTIDPLFFGGYVPHAVELDSSGTPTPVLYDIDGQLRNTTHPDMGAREFDASPHDAMLQEFVEVAAPLSPGNLPVKVLLKNNGTEVLNNVEIWQSVNNGTPTVTNWNGSLSPGDTVRASIQPVTVGISGMVIRAWVSMPNGFQDPFVQNDTIQTDSLYAGMAGVYTIGGTTPDFSTFSTAIQALHNRGVIGNVTFNVRSGTYNEQISIGAFAGADTLRQVVFQSESGDSTDVLLTYYSTNSTKPHTLELDGAKWVTFKKMHIQATYYYYGQVVRLRNGVSHITLSNNILEGTDYAYSSSQRAVVYFEYDTPLRVDINVVNNRILNGAYGIYHQYDASYGGTSHLNVQRNDFVNQSYYGAAVYYNGNYTISNNTFTTTYTTSFYRGILMSYSSGGRVRILANQFKLSGVYGRGIEYSDVTSGAGNNIGLIANNFIQIGGGANTSTGIYANYGQNIKVLHNTVRVSGVNVDNAALEVNNVDNLYAGNNILAIQNGYAIKVWGTIGSDYNNLFTESANVAFEDGNVYPTLLDFRNNSGTGNEEHSYSENPYFLQATGYTIAQSILNNAGFPDALVATDIEGSARDATSPDIGVVEFTPPAVDAGVSSITAPVAPFAAGTYPIEAMVHNFGATPLTQVNVGWSLNGTVQPPVIWTGTLAPGQTIAVSLGTPSFAYSPTDIKAWTALPNGQADVVSVNDTAVVNNITAGLIGIYTIGGVAPDFSTFTAAADALKSGGVVGTVTFNVRNGTYNEQLDLTAVLGASAANIITFQSETNDSTAVTLTYSANSLSNNFVVRMTNAQWFRFRKMTLQSGAYSYCRVVVLAGGAQHNIFEYLKMTGVNVSSTSSNMAVVYSDISTGSIANEYNTIKNCHILNGSDGILDYGYYNDYANGTVIFHNTFANQYRRSINLIYHEAPLVSENIITASTIYSGYNGIVLYQCSERYQVIKNKISVTNSGSIGIAIDNCYSNTAQRGVVANNFISASSSSFFGVYSIYSTACDFVYNTSHLYNTNATGAPFYSYNSYDLTILNNIFIHKGGGYALQNYFGNWIQCDYNDLFTTGGNLVYHNNTAYTNLAAWTGALSYDQHSVSLNPLFNSDTDLHTTNILLDGKATPFAEITNDIDGDVRNPSAPDMGADEFLTADNDAGVFSIDGPARPFAAAAQPVTVTIFNNALDTLESAVIHWEVNGVAQPSFNWTGALLPGQRQGAIGIGSFVFTIDTSFHISAWTSLPNGVPDEDITNDSTAIFDLYAALGGTYTIGGVNPDFDDFTHAVVAMASGGVIAPVTFNVRPGTYTEQILIRPFYGVSAANPIVFQSENGDSTSVVLTYNLTSYSDNYVIKLDSADYYTFRRMGFSAGGGVYDQVIQLAQGARYNTFEHNLIIGGANYSAVSSQGAYSADLANHNNHFTDNHIIGGYYGMSLYGANTTYRDSALVVSGNILENQANSGIRVGYSEGCQVTRNRVSRSSTQWGYGTGISLESCTNRFRVVRNEVSLSSYGTGIYLSNCNNNIGGEGLLANNMVYASTVPDYSTGISLNSSSRNILAFNSVRMASAYSVPAYYQSYSNNISFRNNILMNAGAGYCYQTEQCSNYTASYNDLFHAGSHLGTWNGVAAVNLAEWRSLSNTDAYSLAVDPEFDSETDLHVTAGALNKAGTPIIGITEDFDGDLRDSQRPDIGADEFVPVSANDAGVADLVFPNTLEPFAGGTQPVMVAVQNYGLDTIQSLTVRWSVNNAQQPDFNWTGELFPGEKDTITVGSYQFGLNSHDVFAWTYRPDNMPDTVAVNDTILVTQLYPALSGTYTIGGTLPDFPDFTQAATLLNNGGILGPVTFNVRSGVYHETIQLDHYNGSMPTRPVIFQSETQDTANVILSNAGNVLVLNGADNLTFQNITFLDDNPYSSHTVEIVNQSNYISFLTCHLLQTENTQGVIIHSGTSSQDHHLTIKNCHIEHGNYGIYLYGPGSSYPETGLSVEDNIFEEQGVGAIWMYHQDSVRILRNAITVSHSNNNYAAINGYYLQQGGQIVKNKISSPGSCIELYAANGTPSNRFLIANNFLAVTPGNNFGYGVFLNYGSYITLLHNSVRVGSSGATGSRAFSSYYGDNKHLQNNIFAHTGGGWAAYIYPSTSVTVSNFNDLYSTGQELGYWNGVSVANLVQWRSVSGRDYNSISVDPLFVSDTDLHVSQTALDSAALYTTLVPDDIDGSPRDLNYPDIGADEIGFLADDAGITQFITPVSGCNLTTTETVKVRVQNFSAGTLISVPVAYSVDGGPAVTETVNQPIAPGQYRDYTFTAKVNLSQPGSHIVRSWTILQDDEHPENDTTQVTVIHALTPVSPSNLVPVDGTTGIGPDNIMFSWASVAGATAYDFYLWQQGNTPPVTPTVGNVSQISLYYNIPSPVYGSTYQWKIVAKNAWCAATSPVQSLTLYNLPDLLVQNIQLPVTGFTGQPLSINWEIKNMAQGATGMANWSEGFYLSLDNTLDLGIDHYLGDTPNFSALSAGQSYSNAASFTIPNGFVGNYYVIAVTDHYNGVYELSETNNVMVSAVQVNILLTPPPDLQVTSIIPPNNAFSGTPITVNYTISNLGTGATRSGGWQDRIYFGPNESLNLAQATLLGTYDRSGNIPVNGTYTQAVTGTIPQGISGTYYVHVTTDFFNDEYEQANEGNNTSVSTPVNVTLSPPADLIVTAVTAVPSAYNRQVVSVSWTVENQGGSPANEYWYDQVFLSPDANDVSLANAISVGSASRPVALGLGEQYNTTFDITIPDFITGPHYLYVKTDGGNAVFEYTFDNNNVKAASSATQIQTPDLTVENIVVPAAAGSGDSITVQWQLRNVGDGRLASRTVTDYIYWSLSPTYTPANLIQLFSESGNLSLNAGAVVTRQRRIAIPNGLSGQYYFFVKTDATAEIYENGSESNNFNQNGTALSVSLSPWPDLQPVSISVPVSGAAGGTAAIAYTVRNNGPATISGTSWKDKIYIQSGPLWNPAAAQLVRTEIVSQTLAPGSTYTLQPSIALPVGLATGNYYCFIITDADNGIFEYTEEGNNRLGSTAIQLTGHPPVDLAVNSVTCPATGMSGQNITVSWQVTNNAAVPTIVSPWTDGIYLSTDTIFNAGTDMQVSTQQRVEPLVAGASYTASRTFALPQGLSGNRYLIVVADASAAHNDSNPANNRKASALINITLTPPPDLDIQAFTAPSQAFSGQPLEVHYVVNNNGTGQAPASWTDKLYLSTDLVLDAGDQIVGAKTHAVSLASGTNYTDTIAAVIPITQFGNRILILKTDDNNAVYEYNAESNNTESSEISLVLPPPCDLVVQNIIAPATALAGKPASVSWRLRNVGGNPANGTMKEAVYFSADTIWDVNDALFGTQTTSVSLTPGATVTETLTTDLTNVGIGNYYVIVRTDLLNNIYETNDNNNTLVKTPPVNVSVSLLPMNTLIADSLKNGMPLYYRIVIPDSLAGASLLVQLEGDSLNAVNELYLRHGQVPSRSLYDYGFETPLSADQEIIIPSLQAGTYYLLAYGSTTAGMKQPVTLFAKILNFEIRSVLATQGGNNGKVTIRVDGAKFESMMNVWLERPGYSIPALCVIYQDPTRVFVQFDLRGKSLGGYDVVAEKANGQTARLVNGFTIVPGNAAGLATNIITPPDSRPNVISTIKVEFANNGNTDIINPLVNLVSLDGAPVSLTLPGLNQNLTILSIPLRENGAPPGWLRPGATGTVTVYIKAIKALSFMLTFPDED